MEERCATSCRIQARCLRGAQGAAHVLTLRYLLSLGYLLALLQARCQNSSFTGWSIGACDKVLRLRLCTAPYLVAAPYLVYMPLVSACPTTLHVG